MNTYQQPQMRIAKIVDDPWKNHVARAYLFSANLVDVATIPTMPWTVVHVTPHPVHNDIEPWIWRSAMVDRQRIIEVESESDAKTKSMRDEARSSWRAFVEEITKRANWMKLIGIHPDIQARMTAPRAVHGVRIVSMMPDVLEKMYAYGSAEIVRVAAMLNDMKQVVQDVGHSSMLDFFWPEAMSTPSDTSPDLRYDRAIDGDWTVVSESIYAEK